jgi:hypothetical protein
VKDLLVAVPTRGRPAGLQRLQDAMAATCRADTHFLAGVDDDDRCLTTYLGIPGPEFTVLSGLRGVVACLNAMVMPRLHEYRYVGALGDDWVPRTEGWDTAIIQALESAPFAFANDLYPREPGTFPTHLFARSEVIAALGFVGPPVFRHMFVDAAWQAWGRACGIAYLDDVVIEHLHPTALSPSGAGKAPMDETYAAANACWPDDEAAWHAYLADGLAADVAKIRNVL